MAMLKKKLARSQIDVKEVDRLKQELKEEAEAARLEHEQSSSSLGGSRRSSISSSNFKGMSRRQSARSSAGSAHRSGQ